MSTATVRRRPSWLRVAGVSVAIFLVVLALLWMRVSGGQDPVLGAGTSAAQATTTDTSTTDTTTDSTTESSSSSPSSSDVPTTQAS